MQVVEPDMTMNLTNTHRTPIALLPVRHASLFSWLLAAFRSRPRLRRANDLSDGQLADLNLRRSSVETIDPRQVRLF
jgi:hypothetical protein